MIYIIIIIMDNVTTSTVFDVFFNGVIPIIYAITYQLTSQKAKCLVEDFTSFGLIPLVPVLYAISQNEQTGSLIFVGLYVFNIILFLIFRIILHNYKGHFKCNETKHIILTIIFIIYFGIYYYVPLLSVENIGEMIYNFSYITSNATFILFWPIVLLVLLESMAIFPNENISLISIIIYIIWNLNFYISSFIYLILIPSNSILIKVVYSILLIAGIHTIYLVSEMNMEMKGLVRIILFALPNDELKLEIKLNKIIEYEIKPSLESLSELLKLQGSKPMQMAIFKYTLEKIEPELNLLSELLELQGNVENGLSKDIEKQMKKLEEMVEKMKEGQVESILQRFGSLDTVIKRWKNITTNSEEKYVVTVIDKAETLERRID